ncbi:MAG: hypothetical protein WB992_16830 [Bryobacteraceae bacterium]
MRVALLLLSVALAAQSAAVNKSRLNKSGDAVYAPLWLYNGTWQITRKDLAPGAKPDQLVNQCALIGKYFACQQTVNGEQGSLIVFIPGNKPGQYYTQSITPQGRATGRQDLEISGDHWIYSSTWDQGGTTIYYRTTNVFTGKNHIHFEQLESPNGTQWSVKNTGDEVHVSNSGAKVER